ncbi:MAG: YgeY family selenium metabolism-linked hydrolase [Anaerolineae bacterium]|nr:YgeY family selenium metabolism-linked hydrolase [Anaerolineae bacterium]
MTSSLLSVDQAALDAFAQRLVRTPSLSSAEGQVAALVAQEMRRAGFDEVRIDRMGNCLGRIGSGDGPVLLYDAHMDTVGVGEAQLWKREPFGGQIEAGILYGRGACDMKGALAAMLYAGKALVDARATLHGMLYLACVVQEEPCEGLAIGHIIEEEGIHPTWVVIGEATNLQIALGQRGRVELAITVQGRASHASRPERGVNAIYETARLIVGIELLAPQLNHDAFLGKGSVAVTSIKSVAASRNVVPDSCILHVDRRLTVGETEARALAEIRRILTREGVNASVQVTVHDAVSYTGHRSDVRQSYPHWVTPPDDPLTVELAQVIDDVLGYVPHLGKWDFSTDGVYTAGVAGIPTIGFGPGEERYAHTVDEQIKLSDLSAAARVYAELALRMLR